LPSHAIWPQIFVENLMHAIGTAGVVLPNNNVLTVPEEVD
jgi:hypothetical protein